MTKYKSVKIPEELVEDILKLINERKNLGYRTHSEFIIEATRKRLEEVKKMI